uniref:Uncharacterized protein n=1 Tax=Globisporangium ultimum (strain ATCC 200006 / CBS 805.95 / DAOM BR144) TaxID=431595 RepID=K3WCA0_GLOUD
MKTTNYDNGDFWLLPEIDTAPKVLASMLLVLFACGYFALVVFMLFFRHKVAAVKRKAYSHAIRSDHVNPFKSFQKIGSRKDSSVKARNVFFDVPKLTFQSIALVTYLKKGFPIPIIVFYATMLSFNWLISFYRFQRTSMDTSMVIPRLFYIFDLFFAVFAPTAVIIYAYSNFEFDYAAFRTKEETIPAGIFDRIARLYTDPAQISIFRLGFYHLLFKTGSTTFVKCGLLFISQYKWTKIILYLIRTNHAHQRQIEIPHIKKKVKQSRQDLFFGVTLFICFGAALFAYTIVAVETSKANCKPYPNYPRTFDEWINPPDATEELSLVAKEGQLKMIQLINHALPAFPDALRACKNLEQIILLYTKTEIIPDWAKELKYLDYLHIEGDFTGRNLKYVPSDLFSNMKNLRFIHTGIIPLLTSYPSLAGLHKLQYLAIVAPYSMQELPSLDDATSLISLAIVGTHHIKRLPSFHAAKKLRSFGLFYRNEMCCNGYMNGICDLTDFQCKKRADESEAGASPASESTSPLSARAECKAAENIDVMVFALTTATDPTCQQRAKQMIRLQSELVIRPSMPSIPMVLAFLFSGTDMLAQAFIQVYPTYFANALMNTTNLDDGDFWLLPETDMGLKVIATMLLKVLFDIPKLTFQSLTLVAYLRKGLPIPMIALYAPMLSFNWTISFYRFQRTSLDHSLILTRFFYVFDLFFAVFAPLVVIVYAKYNFHFGYATWHTREESIPAGTFDRVARMFADPTQMSMFLVGFDHLLLKSFSSVFIKCGFLFISNYKWLKIVIFLIRTNHARQRQWRMSTKNCSPYPRCVVISYRWYAGESGCPCATYINRKTSPRTFAEWVNPVDVTNELGMVAREG